MPYLNLFSHSIILSSLFIEKAKRDYSKGCCLEAFQKKIRIEKPKGYDKWSTANRAQQKRFL
jgi:hypothetical protein